jgi:hypothetical protein
MRRLSFPGPFARGRALPWSLLEKSLGEWPERHARLSLPEALFEGTLQRGVPLRRTARMFELEESECEQVEKTGMRIPVFQMWGGRKSAERVPQTPGKNGSGRREELCSGVEAIPEALREGGDWHRATRPVLGLG